jgi:signal transduction histidine kinase
VNLEAHVPLQPRRLNAARFLGELKEAVVSERGIAVKTEVDEMLELHIDERLMTSALTNLLQNGVKFSRAGGTVVLRAHPDGERVVIDVEDQCGGLPPGKEEELFQPFVQRSVDRRGLGLGLTIVRQAIEAHGGRISVRNRPGVGCTFSAVLPDAVATRGSIVPRP